MRRTTIAVAAAAVIAVLGSCIQPKSHACPSGRVCPEGWECAQNQEEVCIPVGGCGNGVIDGDEVCDDGNVRDYDGCRGDCKSDGGCGNGLLDPGEVCDYVRTPDCTQDCLHFLGCNNGVLEGNEQCDQGPAGNLLDGGCPGCRVAICGDGFIDETLLPDGGTRERCDDGPAGSASCNPPNAGPATCFPSVCGDNYANSMAGEQCDVGGVDTPNCDSDCTFRVCGDGHVNDAGGEICDDGDAGVTSCPYGQTCYPCNFTCTGRDTIVGPRCGDGTIDDAGYDGGVEACDDGNTMQETSCPYGADGGSCTACSADCTRVLNLTGHYCGDGNLDATDSEVCDDGNSSSCGTCSADCRKIQVGSATGKIIAAAHDKLADGEVFVLKDGVHTRVFEFDKGVLPDGGAGVAIDAGTVLVAVGSSDNANQVAGKIGTAISNELAAGQLTIRATFAVNSSQVDLLNTTSGSAGNQPITETVAKPDFVVDGMSGGGGSDCPAGTGCTSDLDCGPGLTCQGSAGSQTCQ